MLKSTGIFSLILLLSISSNAQNLQDGIKALEYDKNEQAKNILIQLTVQEPMKGINFYYLGQVYTNLFKSDSARIAYSNGIKAEPLSPACYAGLGELLLDDGKTEDAKQQFNTALSLSKGKDGRIKDANALRFVAHSMAMAENKMIDEAVGYIEQALEIKKSYENYITAGDVYLEKNDGGKSASMYEKAIEMEPKNPKAYVRVAEIWLRVKNAEATFNELNRALQIDSNYAPVLKALAEYYSQTKLFVKAKDYFVRYLQNSENSPSNKARFVRILFRNKDYAEALNVILDLQKSDTSDIYMYRLGGYCYYEVGAEKKDTNMFRPGAAMLESFLSKIDTSKVLSNDYENLGKLYSRIQGKDSLAVYFINKSIEKDPHKIELYKEAGMIYNRSKRFDKSVVCFESYIGKAGKILPADYYLLGMASYFGKQFTKADTAFTKVIEMMPTYADGYYWKAATYVQLDQEAKTTTAKENYEKYISMAEATPEKSKKNLIVSYNYLAKYFIKQDDNAKAKEYLNKILALDPENKEAKEYIKQMDAPPPAVAPAKKKAK